MPARIGFGADASVGCVRGNEGGRAADIGGCRSKVILNFNPPRLVVFTGDLGYSVRKNIVDIDALIADVSWLVIVHAPRKSILQLLRSQRNNLVKHGWRWIPYQVGDVVGRLTNRRAVGESPGLPGAEYQASALANNPRIRVLYTPDIHSAEIVAAVRDFAPDLGLSLAAPILKPEIFQAPRLGTINLHKGKLPEFRGMPPAFWEFWTDRPSVGCSVHWVDSRLDQGAVLLASEIPRQRFSTPKGIRLRLDELGASLVCEAVKSVLSGAVHGEAQLSGAGKTYRKPTLAQESQLAARLRKIGPDSQAAWSVLLKGLVQRLIFRLHRVILWRLLAPRVTVLLYHRVCDSARDNLTVGIEQFERQMGLLARHCEVVAIEKVLTMDHVPRRRRPLVAVTFDDGYLDNYVNAAPALRRHCIPAAFFVTTGIVDSTRQFPHDRHRGNSTLPVLSWQQIRKMRDWGFTIGSHTVNHVDCVAEDAGTVQRELSQSIEDLTRELGDSFGAILAYPYGGKHQMNSERLELVRQAGYVGCLSAFGGSNINSVDRTAVLRRGIHWEFTDDAFLFRTLGY